MSEHIRHYLETLANHFKKQMEFIDAIIEKVREAADDLGPEAACTLLYTQFMTIMNALDEAVAALGALKRETVLRVSSRTLMIDSDKALIEALKNKSWIDPQRADEAITVLDTEMRKLREKYDEIEPLFSDVYASLLETAKQYFDKIRRVWRELGCAEALSA